MGTPEKDKKAPVDPKLRKKMLERWENEGGKVQGSDPTVGSAGKPPLTRRRRSRSKDHSTEGK